MCICPIGKDHIFQVSKSAAALSDRNVFRELVVAPMLSLVASVEQMRRVVASEFELRWLLATMLRCRKKIAQLALKTIANSRPFGR